MGNLAGTPCDHQRVTSFLENYKSVCIDSKPPSEAKGGSIFGGTVGGADSLQQYGSKIYTQQKENLIRKIANSVFKTLKQK